MKLINFRYSELVVVILIYLGVSGNGYCQNNPDTVYYKRLTKFIIASVDYTIYSESAYSLGQDFRDISMQEYKAKIQYALKLKEKKTYLLNRIDYTRFDVCSNKEPSKSFKESYYSVTFSIGLIQVLKNRWKIIAVLSPTLASDFNEKPSSDDFVLQSSLLASKRAGTHFEYGFGIAYSTRFGRALAIPLLSYAILVGNWTHAGVLPAFVSSYYTIGHFDLGVKMSAFGNVYNSTKNIQSNFELDKLGYSRINIGPDFKYRIYRTLYANINMGITLRNRLFSIDSSGDSEMELWADNKWFCNFGLKILK